MRFLIMDLVFFLGAFMLIACRLPWQKALGITLMFVARTNLRSNRRR